ncbi:M48 family metallopeptidase [Bacteroides sp. 51]|uniref:M48 family metallopeptidase n=1 Tax=Bacteroides sp. 51 TaxID=2302938 RepID=UPI0013D1FC8D|nr:M48 family metallopeptidase [Bacteroides sp. 51]NDV81128.1 hypothetical protein [Bacteroides sp. 51]
MDSTTTTIKRQARGVIFRIILFVLVYILLIALGVALIYLSVLGAIYGGAVILALGISQLGVILALVIVGILGFAFMFGLYLIKFLFSGTKNENPGRRQIKESECPALFQAIREVAESTACPMPKKVFLSPHVNACVFYNTSFWSIIFPVKKNLEIGLGLFTCMNVDELKSILAHEFGHFSQNSMKVGSGVYVANTVIYNLAYTEDKWDRFVEGWCRVDINILALFGALTRGFTNWVKRQLHGMYGFVNRAYMKLSRSMEYDADAIACRYIGKKVFSSALRKIDYLSYSSNFTNGMIAELAAKGEKPDNVFQLYDVMTKLLAEREDIRFGHELLMTSGVSYGYPESRVKIENVWDTHPSMDDRIAFASGEVKRETDLRSSWVLLPEEMIREVSDSFQLQFQQQDVEVGHVLTNDELKLRSESYYEENSIPRPYYVFLNRHVFMPEVTSFVSTAVDNPFTPENFELIKEHVIASGDMVTMEAIVAKEIEVEHVYYQGKEYDVKKMPVDEHRVYMESLEAKVKAIDQQVYKYAVVTSPDEKEADEVRFLYDAMAFSEKHKDEYGIEILNQINAVCYHLNRGITRTEEEWIDIKKFIFNLEIQIQQMMKKGNWDMIAYATNSSEEQLNMLQEFSGKENSHYVRSDLDVQYVNNIFYHGNMYISLLDVLNWKAKSRLGKILKERE